MTVWFRQDVWCACLISAALLLASSLISIAGAKIPTRTIVFLHGFDGDSRGTFTASGSSKTWSELLALDRDAPGRLTAMSQYSATSIDYPAKCDDSRNVPELLTHISDKLKLDPAVRRADEVFFVGHSLGGLMIKSLLLQLSQVNDPLLQKTKGAFLLAVPSQGVELNALGRLAAAICSGRASGDLGDIGNNSFLRGLENGWNGFMLARSDKFKNFPRVKCAYETQSMRIAGLPAFKVSAASTATTCHGPAYAFNADHVTIAKPKSTSSENYTWLRQQLWLIEQELHPWCAVELDCLKKDVAEMTGPQAARAAECVAIIKRTTLVQHFERVCNSDVFGPELKRRFSTAYEQVRQGL